MSRFGPTNEGDPVPLEMIQAHRRKRTKATLEGVLVELDIVKQELQNCYGLLSNMQALYASLRQEFEVWKEQRIVELQERVRGGTTHGDND